LRIIVNNEGQSAEGSAGRRLIEAVAWHFSGQTEESDEKRH